MRLRIHRGAQEIGGNCIELESQGQHLLLDLGLPLDGSDPDTMPLPAVSGLASGDDPAFLGVVISHPHQDHYGLAHRVHPNTHFYIGQAASRILKVSGLFTSSGFDREPTAYLRDRVPIRIGPFTVTPYLCDHSAYDAYSLLIEAGGKRLFYSGDFRGHGRKAKTFERFLASPPRDIDVLLMEGTTVSRDAEESVLTEEALEKQILASLSKTQGIALACFSGQNIDRLVTFYKAVKAAGRVFVMDLYMAHVLEAIGNPRLPHPSWDGVQVYVPQRLKNKLRRMGAVDAINRFHRYRIYPEGIAAHPEQFVMTFRSSMIQDLEHMECLAGGKLLYSLWPGYLKRDGGELEDWCEQKGLSLVHHHTSGHASVFDLKRFADSLNPKRLIPIHSFAGDRYPEFFSNVVVAEDGRWEAF